MLQDVYKRQTVISAFVDKIPQSVINGFSVASGMLPALGIAILMQLLFNKKNVAFFFMGWAITALLGVNTVGAVSYTHLVLEALREDIINWVYEENDMITEAEISEKFGVSKTPSREALNYLCMEGFLDKIPNKGYLVRGLSVAELQSLFQFRGILEKASAELAIQYAGKEMCIRDRFCTLRPTSYWTQAIPSCSTSRYCLRRSTRICARSMAAASA